MQTETNIFRVIDGNADMGRYDAEVKQVLSDPQILAWILKYTVREFKESSMEQIMDCMDGKPEVGTRQVRPGHFSRSIDGINTEDSVPGEGRAAYDIRFRVVLPSGKPAGMIINVEAQKKAKPGYDIVTRGIYYCARMLSSQIGNDISAKEYDELQKVYSIWICLDVPQKSEHSITCYRIRKETVHGHVQTDSRYDLLELVMVYLGREATTRNGTKLHGLLNTLLSSSLTPEEKKTILKREYNIAVSMELEGGFISMCNLSEAIMERGYGRGYGRGYEQGLEQGIIKNLLSLVKKGLLSVRDAAQEAGMTQEEFETLIEDDNAQA